MADLPVSVKKVVEAFGRLPGVGPKSAARLTFYLLATPIDFVRQFSDAMLEMKEKVKKCTECGAVADEEYCAICSDGRRNKRLIYVVESSLDVLAFEKVGGFNGVYHVLGGVINPLNHIGPEDLTIEKLVNRLYKLAGEDGEIELVMATNPTMEGEATALYIKRNVESLKVESPKSEKKIKITRIGSGLPMGAEVEYADQATLSRAMEGRREL